MKLSTNFLAQFSLLFILCITLNSCQKERLEVEEQEPDNNISTYENVEPALWPYFQRYEEEARLRGYNVDLNAQGISGFIEDIPGEHIAGQCNFNSQSPNRVTIDIDFWNNSSVLYKEFVVFHELGHCDLYRGHREDQFSNGACVSLMRSGTGNCIDNYNRNTRTSYVDELFFPENF